MSADANPEPLPPQEPPVLLDTCAWLWWLLEPQTLRPDAKIALDEAYLDQRLIVSAISAWEVARKHAIGKLVLAGTDSVPMTPEGFLAFSRSLPFLLHVDLTPEIAQHAVALAFEDHKDPADRFITATALAYGASLATRDGKIQDSGLVAVLVV